MENLAFEGNSPAQQPEMEILPEYFYNHFQRQLVLEWFRRKTGNAQATEEDVGMEAINWVMDGYAAAYERVYKAKESRHELREADMDNKAALAQWLADLDKDIEDRRRTAA
jgi:hypothetical protein